MRVYISGGITGIPDYKERFAQAEAELMARGFGVVNPARIDIPCLSWEEYMHIDLWLLKQCDAVYMLKGWGKSKGASQERATAEELHKIIWYEV